ncbi:helix-turn-helix transcriptional regulator [Massilia sp. CT11-137]
MKKVLAICDKSRSSVYGAIKKGIVPCTPIKLQGRSSAWIMSEYYNG